MQGLEPSSASHRAATLEGICSQQNLPPVPHSLWDHLAGKDKGC